MYVCDGIMQCNYYTHFPVGTVKRFSRAVKKHVDVAEPNIIRQYNQYMGGMDVMHKMLSSYRLVPPGSQCPYDRT
ncbi:PiggyBac transposable element-derived protein 3 [Trichinella papuae]|uniref:PiggyBac transposable element-derived protein 3 n=1 Tax=Trichinella papuae TaxID=268474 RepID=A0A0V1M2B6_9BILA|nr:PiggyBac transposable element-derived protein 3 [Trichinella papuae]